MQLLPPLTGDAGAFRRERPVGAHLPYAAQIDDHTVVTRDGLLLQALQLRGLLFETSETAEINYRKRLRESMLRAVGNSRFALYHHIVRRRVDPTLSAEFPDGFSQRLNEVWGGRLAGRKLYVNDLFLTLVRRPMQGRLGWADRVGSLLSKKTEAPGVLKGEVQRLTAAREALAAGLESYGPRVLSAYETPQGDCSEVLEFLSLLIEGETRPVLMPEEDVGHYLPTRRISFGQETVELAGGGGREPAYVGMVAIKDYPVRTAPGMLDELLRLPVEMTVSQSFGFVERHNALSRMNLALRRMRSADDEAISLRDSLADAKDDAAAGRASFGEHHLTVAIRADTPAAVDEGVAEVIAGLADIGVIAVREDIAVELAFWAQLPGNFKYIVRKGLVSTSNFASLASGHNFPIGEAEGNHWGQALTLLETTAAGPYYFNFNFHTRDLGNFTIIGPTGSGKTVVLNFLLAQARKYRPRLMFFDKDRGAELFTCQRDTPANQAHLACPVEAQNTRRQLSLEVRFGAPSTAVLQIPEGVGHQTRIVSNLTAKREIEDIQLRTGNMKPESFEGLRKSLQTFLWVLPSDEDGIDDFLPPVARVCHDGGPGGLRQIHCHLEIGSELHHGELAAAYVTKVAWLQRDQGVLKAKGVDRLDELGRREPFQPRHPFSQSSLQGLAWHEHEAAFHIGLHNLLHASFGLKGGTSASGAGSSHLHHLVPQMRIKRARVNVRFGAATQCPLLALSSRRRPKAPPP